MQSRSIAILLLVGVLSWAAAAVGSEVALVRLIGDRKISEAHDLILEMAVSNNPTNAKIAEIFFLNDTAVPGRPVLPERDKLIARILNERHSRLYPIVLMRWQMKGFPEDQRRDILPAAEWLRDNVLTLSGNPRPAALAKFDSEHFSLPSLNKGKTLLSVKSQQHLQFAEILRNAGVLKTVTEVQYATSVYKLDGPGQFKDGQLHPEKFFEWVFNTQNDRLFPAVMQIRNSLSAKTTPTRESVGNRILEQINSPNTALAERWNAAVREGMVAPKLDVYVAAKGLPQNRQTLTIRLHDASDLKLANALNAKNLLTDVEMVTYETPNQAEVVRGKTLTNEELRSGHFPKFPENIWIQDLDGYRLADVLNPSEYRLATDNDLQRKPTGGTPLEGEIARENGLLYRSTHYSPQHVKPSTKCNFRSLADMWKEDGVHGPK